MPLVFRAGAHSVAGRRESNEDAIECDADAGLYIVADGTGGRGGGQVAAQLACSTIAPDLTPVVAVGVDRAIEAAISRAHHSIRAKQQEAAYRGMATTVVILALTGDRLHVSHVGDSRAYLLRKQKLISLTRDHSLANYLADNPGKTPKVQRPPDTLMRALGLNEEPPKPDHRSVTLETGDVVLACSDGISSFVPEWALTAILDSARSVPEEDVARALAEAAIAQGSTDNASAIVISAHDEAAKTAVPFQVYGWLAFLEGPRQGDVIGLDGSAHIGKDRSCEISIQEDAAADRHARIEKGEHGYRVRDLGGSTFLNDVRIDEETLVDGDVIRVGGTRMVFKCHRPD